MRIILCVRIVQNYGVWSELLYTVVLVHYIIPFKIVQTLQIILPFIEPKQKQLPPCFRVIPILFITHVNIIISHAVHLFRMQIDIFKNDRLNTLPWR